MFRLFYFILVIFFSSVVTRDGKLEKTKETRTFRLDLISRIVLYASIVEIKYTRDTFTCNRKKVIFYPFLRSAYTVHDIG